MQRKTQLLRLSERKVLIFAFLELKDTLSKTKRQKRANPKIKRKQKDKTKKIKNGLSAISQKG